MFNPLIQSGSELKDIIEGDVLLDSETRERYSTATCMYKITPLGVVAPKHEKDLTKLVRFCSDNQISITPRGGATGLVGQAIGPGIIVDVAKHLNNIIDISTERSTVTVQPGCILNDLNARLKEHDLFYPVDPQSMKTCTIGGNIATNAAGPHGIKYGSTKDQVAGLNVLLSNGDIASISADGITASQASSHQMFNSATELLARNESFIASKKPKVSKYSSGYNVYEAISSGKLNPIPLFCGSEGTLGMITQATLRIYPRPLQSLTAAVYCENYDQTARAVQFTLKHSPVAVELLDKSYTEVGKGINATIDSFIAHDFQSMLIIEMEGNRREELLNQMNGLLSKLLEQKLITTCQIIVTEDDRKALWMLREEVAMKLNTLQTRYQKASFIEDGVVPIEHLPAYLTGVKKILDRCGIPFTLYGHAGSGNIHCATFVEFTPAGRRSIEEATVDVFDLTLSLNASLSGEHGDGLVRTPFLERAFGKELYDIFKEIKNIFDPDNIFNPGKIIGKQDGNFLHDIKYGTDELF